MGRLLSRIVKSPGADPVLSSEPTDATAFGWLEASARSGKDREAQASAVRLQLQHHRNWLYLKDERQRTPLHLAALYGNRPMARALLELGANLDARDGEGRTPLHACFEPVSEGPAEAKCEVAEDLIKGSANIRVKDRAQGRTPLHDAVASPGFERLVEVLIQMGADVNARDKAARTPLQLACSDALRQLLLARGAYGEA
jgi:ankyrin repeat protein